MIPLKKKKKKNKESDYIYPLYTFTYKKLLTLNYIPVKIKFLLEIFFFITNSFEDICMHHLK